jgi:LAO/AO transport system kinase
VTVAGSGPLTYHPTMQDEALTYAEADALIRRARAGERRAFGQIVTALETASAAMPILLAALLPALGRALVIGFTGPPGAGKSTLVDAYTRELRRAGQSVGIIAVDPSSPISGGAILGDRIRMTASLSDDGVYMRSLASQGALGGLSPAAVRIIDALDGIGKAIIILETVGTGQNEIDVAEIADIRIVLAAPGLGDDIQAMKSGLLEIADVLVVNQADRPGAEQTHQQLLSALSMRSDRQGEVPVLKTVATTGVGVAELAAEIARQGAGRMAATTIDRRRRRARYLVARAAADAVARTIQRGGTDIDALADAVLAGEITAQDAARRLLML